MTKAKIIDVINTRISSLGSLISRLEKEQQNSNCDNIVVNNQRGSEHFYLAKGYGKGSKRSHLADKETIIDLATKRYHKKLLDAATKERRQLNRCIVHLQTKEHNSDVEKVFKSLPESLRKHIMPDVITDDGYVASWQSKHSSITDRDSSHVYKTKKGDFVRSKSEAIIADRLLSLGIPYAYENAALLDEDRGLIIHPDFIVLNKKKKKEYIWEHCGLMDDPKYSNDCLHRLKVLSKHGYLQGKNLLFSYESKDNPLDLDYIEKLIKEYLL